MKKQDNLREVLSVTQPRKSGSPVVLGEVGEEHFEATLRAMSMGKAACMPTQR